MYYYKMDNFDYLSICSGALGRTYTLCYSKIYDKNIWHCEENFRLVKELDERAIYLKNQNRKITTTFFPFNRCTPKFAQHMMIRKEVFINLSESDSSILSSRVYFHNI